MNEDLARRGVEHLQAAATEMIAALRAFADLAEELLRDMAASPVWPSGGPPGGHPAEPPGAAAPGAGAAGESSVTSIPVS